MTSLVIGHCTNLSVQGKGAAGLVIAWILAPLACNIAAQEERRWNAG